VEIQPVEAVNLSAAEWAELNEHETVIERGLATFVEVGNALLAIRDRRLYRATHAAFADYCRERWGFSRQRAHQLIGAAEVVANVSTIVDILPTNEAQARELVRLSPDEQREVWLEFVQEATERGYTADVLRQMVRYRDAVREGRSGQQRTPPLPTEGRFDVIYADPPWQYDFSNASGRAVENHYATMTTEAIGALDIAAVAAPDCALFLWATSPKLRDAFAVLDAWGFEYKSSIIWHKSGLGMGFWGRIDHELVLIGTRGQPGSPERTALETSVVYAEKTGHSKKPEIIRQRIERMRPHARRLELFARGEARPGWTHWGLEAPAEAV
jgi:N6-adenosine-specific RNA methylase IME4